MMRGLYIQLFFLFVGYCCAGVHALDVSVQTVRDRGLVGELVGLSRDGGVSLVLASNGARVDIPTADVVRVMIDDRGNRSADGERLASQHVVVMSNGDRFVGEPGSFVEDHVGLMMGGAGDVRLSVDDIRAWVTPVGLSKEALGLGLRRGGSVDTMVDRVTGLLTGGDDVLLLANGDVLTGVLESVDWEGFSFETEQSVVRVSHEAVLAAGIVTGLAVGSSRLCGVIEFNDGSVFRVDDWLMSVGDGGRRLQVRLVSGGVMNLDVGSLRSVSVERGRWRWLGDLVPVDVEQTAMMEIAWGYGMDTNVMGGRLRTAGETFEHGIGVHSRSVLTFEPGGAFDEFVTYLGMDDSGGAMSNVDVSIVVDGRRVFEQANIRRGRLFGPVRVPVRGAERLSLVVDFGAFGGIQDRFNWIESALVKSAY